MLNKPFSTAFLRCYGQKVFIKGRWYAVTEKVQKWCAQRKRLGTPGVIDLKLGSSCECFVKLPGCKSLIQSAAAHFYEQPW